MVVFFFKGGNVFFFKEVFGFIGIVVGFGWDFCVIDGQVFDFDGSVFLFDVGGKVCGDSDFIFYNNKISSDGSVEYIGDNIIGVGEGDDEIVKIDLSKVFVDVDKIVVCVIIYEVEMCNQNFGQVSKVYICVMNQIGGVEIVCYDLFEDVSIDIVMIFGEVYCYGSDWKFKVVGQGYVGGFVLFVCNYGVNV